MLNELWWAVPNDIAGMRKPNNLQEVESLKTSIAGIITVLDDTENHDLYNKANMPFLWLPISGGKTPSLHQIQQAKAFYYNHQHNQQAIAIHCSGGRKRTATLMASLLMADRSLAEALNLITQANPEAKPNEVQIAFLQSLVNGESYIKY